MISGKKVGLRAVEREDLDLLRDWRNIPDFRRNFREVRELNLANQDIWFERSCVVDSNDFMFIIEDLETGNAIGAAGLLYINWVIRSADFSFYIGRDNAYIDEEGFAEESAKLLLNYGFQNLNLNKVWMELYEFDDKKRSFFRDAFGFIQDGILRQNCFEDGRYWDSVIVSLLRSDRPT
jgi:RimJ/RimL family protein N-acetyltransferase